MTHPELTNHNPIETVLNYWELDSPEICEQFNKESPRLIFRIRTGVQDYLLKGLPCSIPETTVKSNVQAHLFLGNENGMAPKLYPTKTGEFYVRHANRSNMESKLALPCYMIINVGK